MSSNEGDSLGTLDLYLIHDETPDLQSLAGLAPDDRRLIPLEWSARATSPTGSRVLVSLEDERLRELAPLAVEREWELGLLPHPGAAETSRALGIRGDLKQVFRHYLGIEPIEADVLTCNDQVVFSSVVIGEVLNLRPYDVSRPPKRRSTFFAGIRSIGQLRLGSYRLTTGKDQTIRLAALGMVVMEQTQSTLIGRSFFRGTQHLGWPPHPPRARAAERSGLSLVPGSLALADQDRLIAPAWPGRADSQRSNPGRGAQRGRLLAGWHGRERQDDRAPSARPMLAPLAGPRAGSSRGPASGEGYDQDGPPAHGRCRSAAGRGPVAALRPCQ